MITYLSYIVTFNSTNRTLKNQLKFKPGITVIRGENEAGKSFILEMIRYALFGSSALRGDRSDYTKLEVTMTVIIKGKPYKIVRKGNKATVNISEAVGTTATNNFIINLLGFNLEVFDICGNANQGELDKLTKDMKPTQRRQMVDSVIGLDQFEEVEKWSRGEANGFKRLIDSLKAQLVEPEKPEVPDDYETSEVLQVRLNEEIRNETIRSSFQHMDPPEMPEEPQVSLAVLRQQKEYELDQMVRSNLESQLAQMPVPTNTYTADELNEFTKWWTQENRGPCPQGYSESELNGWLDDHVVLRQNSEPLRCKNCGEIVEGIELPKTPPMTEAEISKELSALRAWEGFTYDDSLPQSPLSLTEITQALKAIGSDAERQLLQKQLDNLGPRRQNCEAQVKILEQYQQDLVAYETKLIFYRHYLSQKAVVEALPEPEPLLREKLDMANRYETLLTRYEASMEAYTAQEEKIEEAEAERTGFVQGGKALKKIRSEVKQYIIPALCKVSSLLLQEMTDGQRRSIIIDEDFEIYVDKQHVRTLSGSGISVVNLALRIALGQVLTQSVLPIFLADEIDADMAAKRTKATHESILKLRSRLDQIIVVTHKEFEGDESIWIAE